MTFQEKISFSKSTFQVSLPGIFLWMGRLWMRREAVTMVRPWFQGADPIQRAPFVPLGGEVPFAGMKGAFFWTHAFEMNSEFLGIEKPRPNDF